MKGTGEQQEGEGERSVREEVVGGGGRGGGGRSGEGDKRGAKEGRREGWLTATIIN